LLIAFLGFASLQLQHSPLCVRFQLVRVFQLFRFIRAENLTRTGLGQLLFLLLRVEAHQALATLVILGRVELVAGRCWLRLLRLLRGGVQLGDLDGLILAVESAHRVGVE